MNYEVLTWIWQRLLNRPSIGAEENFFGLGGNPQIAARLFIEINSHWHRDLPSETIFLAPTIKALADFLECPSPAALATLLPLKTGTDWPPVFIAHGLGATVSEVFDLATSLRTEHPVYGMQARGIGEGEEPRDSVTAIADDYIEAIRKLQPRGPYVLIGHSLGGLVVLEMARELSAAGESIALLAMLDSYSDWRHWPVKEQVKVLFRRLMRWSLRALGLKNELRSPSNQKPGSSSIVLTPRNEGHSTVEKQKAQYVQAMLSALKQYRPRTYSGSVKFVRAEIATKFPDDAFAVWVRFIRQIEVTTVPGDHRGVITSQVEKLAEILNTYLEEAFASPKQS